MIKTMLIAYLLLASSLHARSCSESLLAIGALLNDQLRVGFALDETSISIWSKKHPDSFVAVLFYRYDVSTKTIWKTGSETATILDMQGTVVTDFKGKGLSNELHVELLRKYPETRAIGSELTKLNREIYFKGLNSGLSPDDAVRETPSYKASAKVGFSRILKLPVNGQLSYLPTEKIDHGQRIILILEKEP